MRTHETRCLIVTDIQTRPVWVTLAAISEHVGKSRATIYRWIALGLPKHQPAGKGGDLLFDPEEVDEWVKSRCFAKSGEGAA